MQNQDSNGSNGTNNQGNYSNNNNVINSPGNREAGHQRSTKYYILGIVTGMLAAFAITLGVIGAVRIYKAVLPGSRGNAAGRTESITNRSVERKLGVLEDTIKKYFWKDVEEDALEDGLYKLSLIHI